MTDDHRVVLVLVAVAVICAAMLFIFASTVGGTVLVLTVPTLPQPSKPPGHRRAAVFCCLSS